MLDGAARLYFSGHSVFLLKRLLSNGWTDFHQIFTKDVFAVLFVNGSTAMKIASPPPKKKDNWAQNVHF